MSATSSSSSSSSNSDSSDTGSETDSETSSTDVEKKSQKPQTRRTEADKTIAINSNNAATNKTRTRRSSASIDEENSPPKKTITAATIANSQKKKMVAAATAAPLATAANNRVKTHQKKTVEKREGNARLRADTDDSERELPKNNRKPIKDKPKESMPTSSKQAPQRSLRPPLKRNSIPALARSNTARTKSSESESDSASGSDSGSSDSSESDDEHASDSSNSFMSQPTKAVKGKRPIETQKQETNRKLTRSLSTRQNKQQQQQSQKNTSADITNSDTDPDDTDKRSTSKSPAKKASNVSKSKAKKEIALNATSIGGGNIFSSTSALSPPQLEKKCPIEGCDSSGHLSGYLDKHFLPEACPIYHNMSASECKERANERKIRNEQRQKATPHSNDSSMSHRLLTAEQREFLGKIKESRARFKPIATTISTEKIKVQKECTDEDREPCLNGIVPDYDLQLFREAQAIASKHIEEEVKELPVGKGIKYITMGKYKMKVWYQSPYPDDAARLPQMYICEFCLRYRKSEIGIKRHAQKCVWRHPPGDEIYRKGKLQVWQVDGKRYKQYCQHLCLLAKFFLDHKTLYYDVEPFLFYIMTLADVDGCHTVGYFSKEKNSFYNVSCILTLPPYQRKGYGRLLIDFSYLLTRVEGKIGSPEKPLSDLGLISYRSYWKDVLLDYLCSRSGNTLSIKDVSQEMAIYSYDIVSTLQALGMMKYWKGKHIVLKKQDVLDEYEERVKRRGNFPKIDETCLRWSPFVPTQANNSH